MQDFEVKLRVSDLSYEYLSARRSQKVQALEKLSFSVEAGQFLTILGPSGCGKSTLLNIIAGLLELQVGQIFLNNQPIADAEHNRALVFQSPALMPWRSVLRNVAYGLEIQGMPRSQARDRSMKYIELVGLTGFTESYPHELSGGMQQRVNLARALATEPQLLLLDEPLAALDPLLRENMQKEIQQIWMQTGTTALFVTHLIGEAIYLGDRVMTLTERPGRVCELIEVDLPRPRPLSVRRDPYFRELEDHLWNLLQDNNYSQDESRETVEIKTEG